MQRLAIFPHALVKFSPACRADSPIQHLTVQRMHKLVAGRRTVPAIHETGRADNLMSSGESLEQFFNGVRLNIRDRGSERARKWNFSEVTRDLKHALFGLAESLNLEFDHLP